LLRMEEEGDLIFNKHNIFGIRLATNGYGISFEKGKFKTPSRTLVYSFELNEIHDPKEHHISATSDGINVSTVVPFKLNNLYEFKVAVCHHHLFWGEGKNKSRSVNGECFCGGSICFPLPFFFLALQPPSLPPPHST